jgi:outer membrane protein assembly factor BamB
MQRRFAPVVAVALATLACMKSTPGTPPGPPKDSSSTPAVDARTDTGSAATVPGPATGKGVLTRGYNLQRTGANLEERILTPAVVNASSFGKLYCRPVDNEIYSSILYVPGVDFGARGKHDAVYVLTMNNSVYAFDALTGEGGALWEKHYNNEAMGITSVPVADLARTTCGMYKDISAVVGIVSTPAIDPATKTMYLVARTKENGNYFQRLHAIDLADGAERAGSPVEITAQAPGMGEGAVNGVIAFDPMRQNQRAALLLHEGVVYIAWASHCDEGPYHGWILGYDAQSLKQAVVFNTTPGGRQGGIWMSGQGPAVDEQGNLYFTTGNGTADLMNGPNRGESFLKLKREGASLTVLDWFTPYNYDFLERTDRDLGSSGPLLVPGTNFVAGASKEGKLYLLDRNNMGRFNATGDTQIVQTVALTGLTRSHTHGTPAYWKTAAGEFLYVMAEEDYLKQLVLVNGKLQLQAMSALRAPLDPGPKPGGYTMPGGFLTLSADGDKAGTGIIWVNGTLNKDSNQAVVPGILRAYDAGNVSKDELWNSQANADRDSFGNYAKYNPPTVYNGRVYLPTFSKQYCVYGRL